jgi:predicted MFS family arabinose efflux permease
VLVDRTDKLRLVRIAQSLLLLEATLLWWMTYTGHITIGVLLTLAAVHGLVSAVEIPARQSLMVDLVGREDLHAAIALNSSGFNLARIVGPSFGALVIAQLGIAWCFGVNALSYLAVLGGLMLVKLPPWERVIATLSPAEGIREGIRYLLGTPKVRALMRMVTVFSILGIPYLTLMPVIARDQLGLRADGYGLLLSCVGLGGLTGALFLAAVGNQFSRARLLRWASVAFGALLVALAFVELAAVAYPVLFLTGFAMIVNNAVANAILQHVVPDEMRGRLMSAYSLVVVGLSQVVGAFMAGILARAFGTGWAVGGAAGLMLVYAVWAFHVRKDLREI